MNVLNEKLISNRELATETALNFIDEDACESNDRPAKRTKKVKIKKSANEMLQIKRIKSNNFKKFTCLRNLGICFF